MDVACLGSELEKSLFCGGQLKGEVDCREWPRAQLSSWVSGRSFFSISISSSVEE